MKPDFTEIIRGQPGPQTNPIRPFLSPLTNFVTDPLHERAAQTDPV